MAFSALGKKVEITVLGCGSSGGVPVIGDFWGDCNPENPKNRRQRSTIHLDIDGTSFLIDAGPDIRTQLLTHHINRLDAVLFTHAHADHIHGIDDLRPYSWIQKKDTPIWSDHETISELKQRFAYCFPENGDRPTPTPKLEPHSFTRNDQIVVSGVPIQTIDQDHGFCRSIGYRFGDFCYSIDVWDLDDKALSLLENVKYWIVSCNRFTPHNAHAHLEKVMGWIDKIQPEKVWLSNLSTDMDYDYLISILPENIIPCHDGLKICASI